MTDGKDLYLLHLTVLEKLFMMKKIYINTASYM